MKVYLKQVDGCWKSDLVRAYFQTFALSPCWSFSAHKNIYFSLDTITSAHRYFTKFYITWIATMVHQIFYEICHFSFERERVGINACVVVLELLHRCLKFYMLPPSLRLLADKFSDTVIERPLVVYFVWKRWLIWHVFVYSLLSQFSAESCRVRAQAMLGSLT
jgi:hypothetical protein